LKGNLFVEMVLIGVLGVYGWVVAVRVSRLQAAASIERTILDRNETLVFRGASGIDVWGVPIIVGQPAGTPRLVAFLLRTTSLTGDLAFWREVAQRLPDGCGVHLVGYCDGASCREAVRRVEQLGQLRIIAYGETIGSQAVLNADAQGKFLLKDQDTKARTVPWRGAGLNPGGILGSILP